MAGIKLGSQRHLSVYNVAGASERRPAGNRGAHIGWPNPDVAIISAQPGRDQLPVKFHYNHLPKFVWEVTVPAGSAVRGIANLKGKKIGVSRLSSGAIPIL